MNEAKATFNTPLREGYPELAGEGKIREEDLTKADKITAEKYGFASCSIYRMSA